MRVATGDVNGDGQADMITAPGAAGGPHVKVFDGRPAPCSPSSSPSKATSAAACLSPPATSTWTAGPRSSSAADGPGGRRPRPPVQWRQRRAGGQPGRSGGRLQRRRADRGRRHQRRRPLRPDRRRLQGQHAARDGPRRRQRRRAGRLLRLQPGLHRRRVRGGRRHQRRRPRRYHHRRRFGRRSPRADLRRRHAQEIRGFFAYGAAFTGGVRVATTDFNNDGLVDIITGAGPGGGPHVRIFRGDNLPGAGRPHGLRATFPGGVYVGGSLRAPGSPLRVYGLGVGRGIAHVRRSWPRW